MRFIIEPHPETHITPRQKQQKFGRGFAYHESSQPFYKIKVLLKNLMTDPRLYVNGIKKVIYKIPRLIEFIQFIEEVNRGTIRIHSGAVATQCEQGILLSGWQDVGKTTLVLLLAKEDYFILGDDVVKIKQNGDIIRLQDRAGIYPHPSNLKGLSLSWKNRVNAWFKLHFAQIPAIATFIQPNLKVSYDKIGKKIDKACLERIYFLEKGDPGIYQIQTEEAINKIMATSLGLFMPDGFPKIFMYSYYFANNISVTHIEDKYRQILQLAIKDKKVFVLHGNSPFDFYKLFIENEKK